MHIDRTISLIKSRFIQIIQDGDKFIIWHSLFGKPKIVSREMREFLELFTAPKTLDSIYNEYELDQSEEVYIKEMIKDYYLIPVGFNERAFLAEKNRAREQFVTDGSRIDYLELIMSEVCNFRCTYCIHFNNLETSNRISNSNKLMRFETAKEVVDCYLAMLREHDKKIAEINFGGGESLLAWSIIEQILNYCVVTYGREFTPKFSINTNASLINSEIARKLKEFRIEIASSLDGLREGNDRVRLTKSGKGTFDAILKGFDVLAVQDYPLDGIAVTLNENNFLYLDEKFIDWAFERKMSEVRIDIDVINIVEVPAEEIVKKLMRLKGYAKKHKIEITGFWSRPVENLNESALEAHVAFCGAVRGNSMCVNSSGKIYSCGYSTTQIGTLDQIKSFYAPEGKYHCFVRDHFIGAIEMCRGCMIEGQCGGGCNITREFVCATKVSKIDRMCDFYRQMTNKLLIEQFREVEKFK